MTPISATIITYNEHDNIERCLQSLRDVVDEIIVVDSFSTDQTVSICQRYGCHIVSRAFDGYGTQRQYATSLTTNTFVLSIDADEELSDELRADIIRLKSEGLTHRIYSVRIENRYFGISLRHGIEGNEKRIRLFNKRYAHWNTGNVSEQLTFDETLQPQTLAGYITHYRCTTVNEFHNKEHKQALLRAHTLAQKHTHVSFLSPYCHALTTYLGSYFKEWGCLDGFVRHTIAAGRARAMLTAYREARRIIHT